MESLFIVIIVLCVLFVIAKKQILKTDPEQGLKPKKSKKGTGTVYHYAAKKSVMTSSEGEFFKMLDNVAEDKYYVFPQVHLSAFLNEKSVKNAKKTAFQHVDDKSVDYVLCDKTTLKPAYAIELDAKTHKRAKEVERILDGAGVPLVRFSDYKKLNEEDIAQRFYEAQVFQSTQ